MRSREKKPDVPASQAPALGEDGLPLARVRRAPRILPFLLTGLAVGVIVGVVLAATGGLGGNYTETSSYGYFGLLFGALGALLGGVAFVIVDKRSQR